MNFKLRLQTVPLPTANEYVRVNHRHHRKVVQHKFSLGAYMGNDLVGVSIVGRPVARMFDTGLRLEILRLCTDGTPNACSFLYSASARAGRALGYSVIGTYILASESGVSLRAAGFRFRHVTKGRSWSHPKRPREDKHPTENKTYWETDLIVPPMTVERLLQAFASNLQARRLFS